MSCEYYVYSHWEDPATGKTVSTWVAGPFTSRRKARQYRDDAMRSYWPYCQVYRRAGPSIRTLSRSRACTAPT
jgi:hypothetical protein